MASIGRTTQSPTAVRAIARVGNASLLLSIRSRVPVERFSQFDFPERNKANRQESQSRFRHHSKNEVKCPCSGETGAPWYRGSRFDSLWKRRCLYRRAQGGSGERPGGRTSAGDIGYLRTSTMRCSGSGSERCLDPNNTLLDLPGYAEKRNRFGWLIIWCLMD